MIEQENLGWLKIPSSDGNFKIHLKQANVETLQEALKDDKISKTARKIIEAEIRKRG